MREMISETKGEKNGCKQRNTSTLSPAASRGPMILFSCAKLQNAPSRGSILSGTTVNRTPESRSLFGGIAVVCTGYTIYKIPGVKKTKGAVGKKVIAYRIKVSLVPQCQLVEQQRKGKMFVMCVCVVLLDFFFFFFFFLKFGRGS